MNARNAVVLFGAAFIAGKPAIAHETKRASVDSAGAEGKDNSTAPSVSSNGMVVAFESHASNLVAGDTNKTFDVFVHDFGTGITERVSVSSSGVQANDQCHETAISGDGQFVAFWSYADNLVAGDTNGTWDVFVHDRSTGITERVSVDSAGNEANGWNQFLTISEDGQVVAFTSHASNLVSGDTNGFDDIFVHDRTTGITERVSVDSSGAQADQSSFRPMLSSDGQIVAFESLASNLVLGDSNTMSDIFVHDRATGITERVSVDSSGFESNEHSYRAAISRDGKVVAFDSVASNLVAGDLNASSDVFVHDRTTGITERVSVDSFGVEGDGDSLSPSITFDGGLVGFDSVASNLVVNDLNGVPDIFVHDRLTGSTDRVSADSVGNEANGDSRNAASTPDGHFVAFKSGATNLVAGDTNGSWDVFVVERCDASWSNYGNGLAGTHGVPAFTSRSDPVLGSTLTLDLSNSSGNPTVGLVFIGYQRASIPTNRGSDLLVLPSLVLPTSFSFGANSYVGTLPSDPAFCGAVIDLQAIEADPGAVKGVSFTQGLELFLGD